MDTFRNTLDSMAARFGEQLHNGWVYPPSPGYRVGCACFPIDIRQANVDLDRSSRKNERMGFVDGVSIKRTGAA